MESPKRAGVAISYGGPLFFNTNMEIQYIIALAWLKGFLLSRWMLKAEHKAEGKELTNGDEVNCILLSILSYGMVLYILINAWGEKVKAYWQQTAGKTKTPE